MRSQNNQFRCPVESQYNAAMGSDEVQDSGNSLISRIGVDDWGHEMWILSTSARARYSSILVRIAIRDCSFFSSANGKIHR